MKLNNISSNHKAGYFAILLGIVALLMPDPMKSHNVVLDTKNISQKINAETSKISVTELADEIIKGKSDFTLIDLSDAKNFNEYHIPSAINLKVEELTTDNVLANQKIILCSNDNLQAAQAWFLLKAKKYNSVYMLEGGMDAWKSKILFPVIPDSIPSAKISEYEKVKEVCKFFGGQPQMSSGALAINKSAPSMPKLAAPSGAAPSASGKKPKKEGC